MTKEEILIDNLEGMAYINDELCKMIGLLSNHDMPEELREGVDKLVKDATVCCLVTKKNIASHRREG